MEIWQSLIDSDQERHEQQLKGLNGGRARGREDGGGGVDRNRKVSEAIEKAIEDVSMMQQQQQQQQQRRGRKLLARAMALMRKFEMNARTWDFWAFVRELNRSYGEALKRYPIRVRMELATIFILLHCLLTMIFIVKALDPLG